jgi:hypothetical protein
MILELAASVLLGLIVLGLVLSPLFGAGDRRNPGWLEPLDPEETKRGIALIALKEIDFDRATGKLSDADYETLKSRYTTEALAAMREDDAGGPDAVEALIAERVRGIVAGQRYCTSCGKALESAVKFCTDCGEAIRAPDADEPLAPSLR